MKLRIALLALVCLLVGTTSAWAQGGQVTVGRVEVTVQDATGAVIPGAKVTLTSERGTRSMATDERGEALFGGVIPGLWTIRAEVPGFKTAEAKNIDVRVNVLTPVVLTMEPGAVEQTVEVTAAAVAIDPTTTNLTDSHGENVFSTIPLGRNLTSAFYLGVGVTDGGGTGLSNPSISGASGFENLYVIDGVNTTNQAFGAYGVYSRVFGPVGSGVTNSFIQEVQVTSGGFEANYGQALGGVVSAHTKSGSNDLHGAVYGYYTPRWASAGRKQPNLFRTAQGTETHGLDEYDFGVEMGGRIIKDRLFWFGAFNPILRRAMISAPTPGNTFAYSGGCDVALAGICHPLGHITSNRRTFSYAMKLSANITSNGNHNLEASWYGDPTVQSFGPTGGGVRGEGGRGLTGSPLVIGGVPTPRDFSRLDYSGLNWQVRYNGAFSPKWVLNAQIAQGHQRFAEERFLNLYQITDRSGSVSGNVNVRPNIGGVGFFENYTSDTKQLYLNSTHQYKLLGAHEIQIGMQWETSRYKPLARRSGPDWPVPVDPITVAAGVNGLPQFGGSGTAFPCLERTGLIDCGAGLPVFPRTLVGPDGVLGTADDVSSPTAYYFGISRGAYAGAQTQNRTRYGALYASDTWSFTDRITLKLGLRWEQMRLAGDGGQGLGIDNCVISGNTFSGVPTCSYSFTGNWAPRVGVTVDPTGKRKAKVSFSFGRIFERIPLDLAQRSLGSEASFLTQIWGATAVDPFSGAPVFDPFGGSVYLPSSRVVCPNPTPTPAVLCSATGTVRHPNPFLTGNAGTLIFPGTKMQYLDEFVLGYEQELPHGFFIRGRYLDRRIKRIVEDTSPLTVEAANAGLPQQYVIGNVGRSADFGTNPQCVDPTTDSVFNGCPLTGFSFANPFTGLAVPDGLPDGFPNPVRNYQAVEATLERRLRDNWQMVVNYRIAKLFGNFEGSFRNDNGQQDPNISSLFDFTNSVGLADQFRPGLLPTDRTHIVNFYGSYMINSGWANGLNIGTYIRLESGTPVSKLDFHPAYFNAGEIPVGGRGAEGKTLTSGTMDLHFDYPWKITERFTLKGAMDLFNLFNAKRARNLDQFNTLGGGGLNPDFLTPTVFQTPFNMRFSLRFQW